MEIAVVWVMFFSVSKMFWMVAQPTTLIGLMVLLGAVLLWTRWRRLGRLMVVVSGVAYALCLNLATGQLLVAPLENRFSAQPEKVGDVDGIIVLGGPIDAPLSASRGQVSLFDGSERYFEFIRAMNRHPQARGVISGGNPSLTRDNLGQAHYAKQLLRSAGFDTDRVLFETQARNTSEHADLSKLLAKPTPGSKWLLITSAYHMPRAMGVFEAAGWNVVPHPVDFRSEAGGIQNYLDPRGGEALGLVDTAVKEWIGLAAYYLTGRTPTLFPGPKAKHAGHLMFAGL